MSNDNNLQNLNQKWRKQESNVKSNYCIVQKKSDSKQNAKIVNMRRIQRTCSTTTRSYWESWVGGDFWLVESRDHRTFAATQSVRSEEHPRFPFFLALREHAQKTSGWSNWSSRAELQLSFSTFRQPWFHWIHSNWNKFLGLFIFLMQ